MEKKNKTEIPIGIDGTNIHHSCLFLFPYTLHYGLGDCRLARYMIPLILLSLLLLLFFFIIFFHFFLLLLVNNSPKIFIMYISLDSVSILYLYLSISIYLCLSISLILFLSFSFDLIYDIRRFLFIFFKCEGLFF